MYVCEHFYILFKKSTKIMINYIETEKKKQRFYYFLLLSLFANESIWSLEFRFIYIFFFFLFSILWFIFLSNMYICKKKSTKKVKYSVV